VNECVLVYEEVGITGNISGRHDTANMYCKKILSTYVYQLKVYEERTLKLLFKERQC
jgi:hypothetical protein